MGERWELPTATARDMAARLGLNYYKGTPCKYGHPGYRYLKGGSCVDCHRERPYDPAKAREAYVRLRARPLPLAPPDPLLLKGRQLQTSARKRARQKGLPFADEFGLRSDYVGEWIRRQPNCPICGETFDIVRKGQRPGRTHRAPSLDELVIGKDYTIKNTRLICWGCNCIKRNHTVAVLRRLADWIETEMAVCPA